MRASGMIIATSLWDVLTMTIGKALNPQRIRNSIRIARCVSLGALAFLCGTLPAVARHDVQMERFLLYYFASDARLAPIVNECINKNFVQYTARALRRAGAASMTKNVQYALNSMATDLDTSSADRYICLYRILRATQDEFLIQEGMLDDTRIIVAKLNDLTPAGIQYLQKRLLHDLFDCHDRWPACVNTYGKKDVFGIYCLSRRDSVFFVSPLSEIDRLKDRLCVDQPNLDAFFR
jgi:hypothetical protein